MYLLFFLMMPSGILMFLPIPLGGHHETVRAAPIVALALSVQQHSVAWKAEQVAFVPQALQVPPQRAWCVEAEVTMLAEVPASYPFR